MVWARCVTCHVNAMIKSYTIDFYSMKMEINQCQKINVFFFFILRAPFAIFRHPAWPDDYWWHNTQYLLGNLFLYHLGLSLQRIQLCKRLKYKSKYFVSTGVIKNICHIKQMEKEDSKKYNKSDIKRRNTLSCLDQYMEPNSKHIGDKCPPKWRWVASPSNAPLRNVLSSFDEQDKLSSERIGVSHPNTIHHPQNEKGH